MNNRLKLLIILFFTSSLLISSCGTLFQSKDELPDIGKVTVGYLPILAYSPIFIAQDKGYFEEQGLDVELLSFQSGNFMMPLLATGELDIGGGQPGVEYFNAVNQNLDVKMTSGFSQHREGYGTLPCLVRKDLFDSGEITEFSDLKGTKIAVNVERGIVEYFVAEILKIGDLTLDDVNLITIPFPDMTVALANKAVDLAMLPEPLGSMAVRDEIAVILIQSDEVFENPENGVIYFGKRILQDENREIGVRFMVAFLKAMRDLQIENGYNDQNLEIISSYTNIPVPAIQGTVKSFYDPNAELNQTFIKDIMNYYIDNGYTEFSEPLKPNELFDLSYISTALDRLGKFEE